MTNVTRVGWERGRDTAETRINREWLVANGLGGYASGTLAGVPTRRYHGLLVSALPNPWGRTMMLDHLVEQVDLPDGTQYRLNAESRGSTDSETKSDALDQFRLELGLPVWTYLLGGILLERRLMLAHMQNTVYLRYRLLPNAQGEAQAYPGTLGRRPAMHFRPHDAPVSRPIDPYTLSLIGDRFEVSTNGPLPSLKKGYATFGSFNNLAKITPEVVAIWAEILRRAPTARLMLKYRRLGDAAARPGGQHDRAPEAREPDERADLRLRRVEPSGGGPGRFDAGGPVRV